MLSLTHLCNSHIQPTRSFPHQLRDADPAALLPVSTALREGLAAAAALHGEAALTAAMAALDEHVVAAVRQAASGASPGTAGLQAADAGMG